jgi:hypothetical protein
MKLRGGEMENLIRREKMKLKNFLVVLAMVLFLVACESNESSGVNWANIKKTNINVRGSAVDLAVVTINAPADGYAVVRFDGDAIADTGDRLVLAASNASKQWLPNEGNVSFEGDNHCHPFSHSRVYGVSAGSNTFYAIAQNYVNENGNGKASIYGILTVTFFKNKY